MNVNKGYVLFVGNIFSLKEWKATILYRGVKEVRLFPRTAKCYAGSVIEENPIIRSLPLFLVVPHSEAVGHVEIEEAERLFVFGHERNVREIAVVGEAGFQRVHGLFLFAEFGVEA